MDKNIITNLYSCEILENWEEEKKDLEAYRKAKTSFLLKQQLSKWQKTQDQTWKLIQWTMPF